MGNEAKRLIDDAHVAIWINSHYNEGIIGDLGCGDARIISLLKRVGRDVWGVDSQLDSLGDIPVSLVDDFENVDLSKRILLRDADIAITFEVAEHLPSGSEDTFIFNLASTGAKIIIMSVATTGQEAKSHFNIKPRRMWIDKIEAEGYKEDESMEYKFKKDLHNKLQIKQWYVWNIMIFNKV